MEKRAKLHDVFHLLSLKYLSGVLLLALVYFVAGRLGLLFDAVSGFATLVWVPSGLSLAALVLFGLRFWPGVLIGAFLTNITVGAVPLVAFGIGLGNMFEAVAGASLLRFLRFEPSLSRVRHVISLIVPAAFLATIISATIGVTSLFLGGVVSISTYVGTWIAWWIGDMMGILIFASVLMVWGELRRGGKKINFTTRKFAEGLLTFFLLALAECMIFFVAPGSLGTNRSLIYLIFLPLIWISFRFRQQGSVTAIFITSLIAIWGTSANMGPFAGTTLNESLIALQLFMGAVSITILLLAATISEREHTLEDLKAEEEKLAQEKAQAEAVFLSIGDGLVVTDHAGNIVMVNKAFEEMIGWRQGEVVGKSFAAVVPREDEEGVRVHAEERALSRVLAGEKVSVTSPALTHYFVRKNGTRFPASVIVHPITNGHRAGAVETFRDITTEKEIERVKSEFVSLASHQLRTPLTAINWHIELMVQEGKGILTESQQRDLKLIHKSSMRMIRLVNGLLNITRVNSGRLSITPVETDLMAFVRSVVEDLAVLAEQGSCQLEPTTGTPTTIRLPVDQTLLRQVLHNLLTNAMKYTPVDRQCRVRVTVKEDPKHGVVIAITDDGIGIPLAAHAHIFEKFYRAPNAVKRDTEGTGLGLYVARMVMRAAGGDLWFTSTEGHGSTFYVSIPRHGMREHAGQVGLAST